MYREIEGDLIELAKYGRFQVIAHGCNCFCAMGAGIAPQMAEAFGADKFPMENDWNKGDMNKLGTIDWVEVNGTFIVNAYTQYGFGANHEGGTKAPINYSALHMCLQKMNHTFKGLKIGLPKIGCGLAGADWNLVRHLIQKYLTDCDVTVVNYKK